MDLKLDGKVALITGSSKGIGEGIARGLAREGATVIIHGRSKAKTEQVAHDIISQGGRAYVVIGDLTHEDEVQRLVDEAQAFVKPVEIVINNAGGSGETEDWVTTRPETWATGYDRNVLAAVRVTSRLLPAMRAAKWGRVVNVSSLAGLMPSCQKARLRCGQSGNDCHDGFTRQGRRDGRHHGKHHIARNNPQHQSRRGLSQGRRRTRPCRRCTMGGSRAEGTARLRSGSDGPSWYA